MGLCCMCDFGPMDKPTPTGGLREARGTAPFPRDLWCLTIGSSGGGGGGWRAS